MNLGLISRRASLTEVRRARELAGSLLAAAWARLRRRRYKPQIIKPYIDLNTRSRRIAKVATPLALGLICLVYGFFFAATAPYLMVPFAAPIAILALLSVWALPDHPHAPTKTMELFFSAMMISLVLWPNYLALALPGLPWITAIRLTGFPMAMLLLVSLSTSVDFRREVKQTVLTIPNLWVWFLFFTAIQFLTIATAKSPPTALQKTLLQQVYWTGVIVIAAWICRKPGRAYRYILTVLIAAIPIVAVSLAEASERHLLWSGQVPSFLKIDDPIAGSIFASTIRNATGQYRAKATFSTPLGLAEYLGLLTPFLIHFAVNRYPLFLRAACWAAVPVVFFCVRLTDARLGVVGFIVSVLFYFLFWGMLRFRRNRRDLLAATIVYAYPIIFSAAAAALTAVPSLSRLVFGGGAQAASDQARRTQLAMGIPKVLANPFGHGAGGSGAAMGYGAGEFVAIDNYYLSLGLDYGVIGLVSFLGLFLVAISWSVRQSLRAALLPDRELTLLIPIAVVMSAFLVIKSVFSQIDLHPMIYMYLGVAIALCYRVDVALKAAKPAEMAQEEAVALPFRPSGKPVPIARKDKRRRVAGGGGLG